MTRPLVKYQDYNRKEAHDIFAPYTPFKSGTGSWGMQGIVKIPDRENDYVFFVSYGRSQSGHAFEEGISEDGIFTWQSQPHEKLNSPRIQKLINHNHLVNNIYLFLRKSLSGGYKYLGRLAYLTHDIEREAPVYFKWQILDWELSNKKAREMGLELQTTTNTGYTKQGLIQTDPPTQAPVSGGKLPNNFSGRHIDFAESDDRNRQLGKTGEELVLEFEKNTLIKTGRSDLAEKVIHTSVVEGDGAGYDILSFNTDGENKYIEVKTTSGGASTPFYITLNELNFSREKSENYYLYRVYELNSKDKAGKFYLFKGSLFDHFNLEAIQFKVRRNSN